MASLSDLSASHGAFLAEVSKLLACSLEYQTTLETVARAALPDFADWCVVDVVDARASIERVAVAHVDPCVEQHLEERARLFTPAPTALEGVPQVLRSGRAHLIDESQDPMLAEFGAVAGIVSPLRVGDAVLGALTLASSRGYGLADLQLAEELTSRCAQAIANARQYQSACEAIDLRDTFVATISHDLKNPLATIGAQAQLLRRLAAAEEDSPPGRERLRAGIRRVERTVERMTRMLDGLLDVTRLELGGRLELQRAPMDLVEVTRRVVAEHQERAPRHRIQLAGEATLTGNWDMARIERALDNLVGNAVKYSPDGGVIMVLCVRERDELDDWAILSVRDHGVGIPAADLGNVFERFHRARNVGQISGTGIGLAMIRDVIELHGGTIDVESTEGMGSTFTVRLPVGSTRAE
jgi:signal transduction histidine kinase